MVCFCASFVMRRTSGSAASRLRIAGHNPSKTKRRARNNWYSLLSRVLSRNRRRSSVATNDIEIWRSPLLIGPDIEFFSWLRRLGEGEPPPAAALVALGKEGALRFRLGPVAQRLAEVPRVGPELLRRAQHHAAVGQALDRHLGRREIELYPGRIRHRRARFYAAPCPGSVAFTSAAMLP